MKISDIKVGYTEDKIKSEKIDLWVFYFARPLSWPVTWLCVMLGLSASAVTFISIVTVIIGSVLIALGNFTMQVIGVSLFSLWIILDCVDGNIARYKKTFSEYGEYIDAVGGYFASALLFLSLGYLAYKTSEYSNPEYFYIAGSWATTCSLFARLLYQKNKNTFKNEQSMTKPSQNTASPAMIIAQNLGAPSGLVLPASLIATVFGVPEYIVVIWAGINTMMLLYTLAKTLKRR